MARYQSAHLFAGACGDLIASEMSGGAPIFGANHWTEAVATADRNYNDVDYAIGDLAVLDPKKLGLRGKVDVLFASPECDGHSGARNYADGRRDLGRYEGPDAASSGIQRSRATMWCPIAFADALRPSIVIMENVVECASWAPLARGHWTAEWHRIGYEITAVCLNSAVIGAVPQSRDRIYLIAYRKGLPKPNLEFNPTSYCWACERVVSGEREWKPAALKRTGSLGVPVGKYGSQYVYVCGAGCRDSRGRRAVVSPFVSPAWTAIDWALPAPTIRDRERNGRPLRPNTISRIERGMVKYGWKTGPQMVPLDRLSDPDSKGTRPLWLPSFTRTARQDLALAMPPGFQVTLRGSNQPQLLEHPWATVAASGNHNALVVMNNAHNVPRHVNEPVGAVTGGNRHYLAQLPEAELVVQVGGNTFERPGYTRAWTSEQPMPTLTANADKALAFAPTEPGEGMAVANFGGHGNGHTRDTLTEPLGTVTAGGQQAVMRIPPEALLTLFYSGGDQFRGVHDDPAATLTSVDRFGLAHADGRRGDVDIRDVAFRMIEPHENQRIMGLDWRLVPQLDGSMKRIPFELAGSSKRNNTKLAGNGITPDVEAKLVDRLLAAAGA